MNLYQTTISVLVVVLVSACSNKSLYQYGQNSHKNHCLQQAKTAWQLEECEKTDYQSFEEYQQQVDEYKKQLEAKKEKS